MQGLYVDSAQPKTISFIPMASRSLSNYMDRVETFQGMQENGTSDIFKEAEAYGFDPVMLRLLVREKKMSMALDDFLARRLVC
jgi:uncharacterized protein (UPF0335 family)